MGIYARRAPEAQRTLIAVYEGGTKRIEVHDDGEQWAAEPPLVTGPTSRLVCRDCGDEFH